MTDLIVRNLDDRIVQSLKQRAARQRRSAEAEHRLILETALLKTRRRSLADVLATMPDVGRDEDFNRTQDEDAVDVLA